MNAGVLSPAEKMHYNSPIPFIHHTTNLHQAHSIDMLDHQTNINQHNPAWTRMNPDKLVNCVLWTVDFATSRPVINLKKQ